MSFDICFATHKIIIGFASSLGWKLITPKSIHRRLPPTTIPYVKTKNKVILIVTIDIDENFAIKSIDNFLKY